MQIALCQLKKDGRIFRLIVAIALFIEKAIDQVENRLVLLWLQLLELY